MIYNWFKRFDTDESLEQAVVMLIDLGRNKNSQQQIKNSSK